MISRRTLSGISILTLALLYLAGSAGNALGQCQTSQIDKIADSSPFPQSFFGHATAIEGDVAVVGAYKDWTVDREAGTVFVYRHNGSGWIEEAELVPSDLAADDEFGVSVGVSGNTIVVGSHFDDDKGEDSGSAYVFTFDGRTWSQAAKLTASDGVPYDNFGYSVAIDGELIVVGANLDDDAGGNSGSAYIYERPTGGWSDMRETAKLTSSDAATNDEFGKSVSIDRETVVIGAHYDSSVSASLCGAVYLFQLKNSEWMEQAKLTASDPADQDRLGISVSIDGDLVAAGAWGDDDDGLQSGSVYLFEKPPGVWRDMTQTAKLTASDAVDGDHFGWSVAVNGDHVVVGAPAHLMDGSGYGAAYAFDRPAAGWTDMTETAMYTASDGAQDDEYGTSVAVSGERFVVGAPFHKTGNSYGAGAAYINGGLSDCQPNGILDACDLALGSSRDYDSDGIPDECEGPGEASGNIGWSMTIAKGEDGQISLFWEASCISTDDDYEIYEGTIGDFASHGSKYCSTGGARQMSFLPAEGGCYYLVVPASAICEGSYGIDSEGWERLSGTDACLPQVTTSCSE